LPGSLWQHNSMVSGQLCSNNHLLL
jgi:hypothetical protein